jgi:hypothetical protein
VFQHRAAFAVLEDLKETGSSINDLAQALGEDPAWLQRKLHGQTPADLGHVMSWALHRGVHVLPVFDDSSGLRVEAS